MMQRFYGHCLTLCDNLCYTVCHKITRVYFSFLESVIYSLVGALTKAIFLSKL